MRVLLTAFEPFGGESLNASREAVARIPARVAGLDVVTATLPTSFARSLPALEQAIAKVEPAIVLCVGQTRFRSMLSVERVAINLQDARIPDNDGAQPFDRPVVAGGPAAYFARLPVKDIAAAMVAAGLRAEVSNSAGTFVCNHVFYGLLHFAATRMPELHGGVLHVPRMPVQTAGEPDAPSMPLDEIVRGIVSVLEVTAAQGGR
jgi:pyroglutamyl-peptidase